LRSAFGVDLGPRQVFQAPTVAQLAALVGGDAARDEMDVLLPIQPRGEQPPVFCVHPALGLSWCYAGLVRYLPRGTPVYGLQARGIGRPEPLPDTLEDMAEDYLDHVRR